MTPIYVWDELDVSAPVSGAEMDVYWAAGWRHFGRSFFRYNLMLREGGGVHLVTPLRLPVAEYSPSKSQRRVLRRNEDVRLLIEPAQITPELEAMFQRHKARFQDNVPENLGVFLSEQPAYDPCRCLLFRCEIEGRTVAASYCDVGDESVSSVYALFDPDYSARSLGVYTMVQELLWAQQQGMRWHYPGYATLGASHYDYKKLFRPLQTYDWECGTWLPWDEYEAKMSFL